MAEATVPTERAQIGFKNERRKKMTKRQRMIYETYEASEKRQLLDVYSSCSAEKRSAFDKCRRRCAELGANRFRIIGANSWSFTVGFEYRRNAPLGASTRDNLLVLTRQVFSTSWKGENDGRNVRM